MKKRILAIALVVICLLTLASCGCKHQWLAPNCTSASTCSICGEITGAAAGHVWNAATCSKPKTCEVCGQTQGSALSHSWRNATCTQPKVCTECGAVEGTAIGHDWIPATSTTPKTCSKCGATEGSQILDIVAGDIITMGYYGNEKIQWIVLEFDPATNQALLISKYCLDAMPFHTGSGYGSWENSTLRKWLNNNFISAAFNQDERGKILSKYIDNPVNNAYGTDSGSGTYDRVFLLSYEEANYYFTSRTSRQGVPTAYCKAQGCYDPVKYAEENHTELNPDDIGHTWWWLRTAGCDATRTCNVESKGAVSNYGALKTSDQGAVRPAMWIQLG